MNESAVLLETRNLSKTYGAVVALRSGDLTVRPVHGWPSRLEIRRGEAGFAPLRGKIFLPGARTNSGGLRR